MPAQSSADAEAAASRASSPSAAASQAGCSQVGGARPQAGGPQAPAAPQAGGPQAPAAPQAGAPLRIAFLGPFGTFTEQAVRQVASPDAVLLPMTSAPQALAAVRNGQADRAVVPIENSIEGGVNATLDALAHGQPLVIVGEMHVSVVFQLAVRPGTTPEQVRRIGTHPHAWAQCRGWVESTFPGAVHVPATSTAAAAQLLSQGEAGFDAALCNAVSVSSYGLQALYQDVADNPGAVTRFVLVSRPGSLPAPTGADKTTIQVALPVNESGALLTMLEQFAVRGVDLSRIESRPSGDGLGNYEFSIDIVGHVSEERVQAALVGLHRHSPWVRFMGSYPRIDGVANVPAVGTSDDAFRSARNWVEGLLAGRADIGRREI